MPNIKSAIKRVKVNNTKKDENRGVKSELSTYIKKFKALCETNVEEAEKFYPSVVSVIDGACKNNIIAKNNANRKKARLAVLLNKSKNA